jgi:hypothetical protein
MIRTFAAYNIIVLPRFSAPAAMTAGTSLVTAARKREPLPPVFVPPLERLIKSVGTLGESRVKQREARDIDGTAINESDQKIDGTWSGFYSFLNGWTKMINTPEVAEKARRAGVLIEAVFPDGLRFLNAPHRVEWAESQTRLDRLRQPDFVEHVEALGGAPFIKAIEVAQEAYGVALNVTDLKAGAKAAAKVRGPLDEVMAAMRSYVLRVTNYLDENEADEAAQELGYALLAPLATWKATSSGRKAAAPGGDDAGDAAGEPETPAGV